MIGRSEELCYLVGDGAASSCEFAKQTRELGTSRNVRIGFSLRANTVRPYKITSVSHSPVGEGLAPPVTCDLDSRNVIGQSEDLRYLVGAVIDRLIGFSLRANTVRPYRDRRNPFPKPCPYGKMENFL